MKNFLLAVILAMAASSSHAQSARLSGHVYDADSIPVEYANIAIFTPDSTFITGTATSETGSFAIDLPKGEYLLKANALSFKNALRAVSLKQSTDIGPIILTPQSTILGEIEVRGVRPTVRRNATGLVVSVENVKHLQDKTVDRILNYSPGVFVDKDGNITINGNGGVTVIVNDKTLHLNGQQLASYLKSIQGSDLKNIKIFNNPTSAYSAEGSGGVIIITTRRRTGIGLTGYVSANYSFERRSSFLPAAGLAYSFGKFTLYGNYTYSDNRSVYCQNEICDYLLSTQPLRNETTGNARNHDRSHNWRFGADWQIAPKHFLGIEYNGQTNRTTDIGNSTLHIIENDILTQKIISASDGLRRPHNNLLNINYSWNIDTLGHKLKFVADYGDIVGMKTDDGIDNRYFDGSGAYLDYLHKRSISNESTQLWTAQADYEKPFAGSPWKLSGGLKYSHIGIDYDYNLLSSKGNDAPQEDTRFKDRFRFTETLLAAYVNGAYNSDFLDANVGVRAEYTDRKGISYVKDTHDSNDDLRMFPSCFLYYKPGSQSSFMAYYGMRIQRPSYSLLNPFVVYLTDLSFKTGNPALKPMISNVVELTYVMKNRYYLSLRANLAKNRIRDFSYTEGEYTVETFGNISSSNMWYINAYIPFDIRKWTSTILLNVGVLDTRAGDRKRKAMTMDLSWDNYLQLTDYIGIQSNLGYTPPYKDVYQTFKRHIVKLDLCVDFSFGNSKWYLSAGVDDVFNSMHKRAITLTYPTITQVSTTCGYFGGRTAWATLKFNFSTSKRARERRKEKSNQEEINRL